ncbi:MAG: hypothetical protein FWH36_05490 [Lentimicrobiaceae bacterium]|nr:hypothetical protein [Lentimicrobiaceae bacterium]
MAEVSSKKFVSYQKMHFDRRVKEEVSVRNGEKVLHLMHNPIKATDAKERLYLEPDEDFYRAVPIDEFIEKALARLEKIDEIYAKK